MSALRILLGLLVVAQVGVACVLWPRLPANIPTHFGLAGRPDAWGPPDAEWFVISGALGLIGAAIGYGVPVLFRHWARSNPGLLNVPDRERFRRLAAETRVRAISSAEAWLLLIGGELQALTAFLLVGTFLVARQDWDGLPVAGLYGALGLLLLTAVGMAIASTRAVRREIAAAG